MRQQAHQWNKAEVAACQRKYRATHHADPHDLILEYPFPLRKSCVAILRLPRDLTRKEVERIQRWLNSLVIAVL